MNTDVLRRTFKRILSKLRELFKRPTDVHYTSAPLRRVTLKAEAFEVTSDELLKRMTKEQAITLVQGFLRRMEESLNVPDIPAAKTRMEKVLEELKLSQSPSTPE